MAGASLHWQRGWPRPDVVPASYARNRSSTPPLPFVVLKLQKVREQLSDDRTALAGIGSLLELAQDVAGSVPLAGPIVAQALGYYAAGAKSCGDAAVAIQGKIIEQDVAVHFSHPPPERHLYTEDEMAALRIGNDNARDRVKRMLQVRRLIALIGSEDAGLAREMTR